MITVIGGGPAGCIAAGTCAKEDEVVLFEEHEKGEHPVQCAGLVSISGLEKIGIKKLSENFVQNRVRGALLHSPSGNVVEIDAGHDMACVIDRKKFDEYLLNSAVSSGVELINEKVDDIEKLNKNFNPRKIIIAAGIKYGLHRKLNFPVPKILAGLQYEMKVECDPDFVELYFNVPGFFSWIIPVDDYARIGLCTYRNPGEYLKNFIKNLKKGGRIKNNAKILNKTGGAVPVYSPKFKTEYEIKNRHRFFKPRDIFYRKNELSGTIKNKKIILVGDSAAQVKATTGGGIVMGGIAAQCVSKNYEKQWRKKIGKELYLHLLIRNFLNRLSEREINNLLLLASEHKDIIQKKGDMDMASVLAFNLMKRPKFSLKIFCMFARSFF